MENTAMLLPFIPLVSIIGAGLSVYIALKVANAEIQKDVTHIIDSIKAMMADLKELEKSLSDHKAKDPHIPQSSVDRLERGQEAIFAKLEKLSEKVYTYGK